MSGYGYITPICIRIEEMTEQVLEFENFRIRRINNNELKSLFGLSNVIFSDQKPKSVSPVGNKNVWDEFLSRTPYRDLKELYVPYWVLESKNNELVNDFLLIVRLVVGTKIFAPITVEESGYSYSFNRPITPPLRYVFDTLSTQNIQKIRTLEHALNNCDDFLKDSLLICFDEQMQKKQRFFSAVTILENILCSGQKQEVGFRFRLYGGVLCNLLDIECTSDDLKKIYSVRSKIVHGNPLENKDNFEELFSKCMDVMRGVLIYYLENKDNENGKNIADVIDKKIMTIDSI